MMRISRPQMFMSIAREVSKRGTCFRLNVGAILVSNDRDIIGIGYNGAPAGEPHCTGTGCQYYTESGCKVLHAECNALKSFTHNSGPILPARDRTLYCTHSPCMACAKDLSHLQGLKAVYYEHPYRDLSSVDWLAERMKVYQVLPSGLIVDHKTREIQP